MKDPKKNEQKPWHKKWSPIALANLGKIREEMRANNLYDTQQLPTRSTEQKKDTDFEESTAPVNVRQASGEGTDLGDSQMGARGNRFGRNLPLDQCYPDLENMLVPNPREVSKKLLTRDEFTPNKQLNLLAASWIQFMQHGWFNHTHDRKIETPQNEQSCPFLEAQKCPFEIPIPDGDRWPAADPPPETGAFQSEEDGNPEDFRPMKVPRTPPDPTRKPDANDGPPTFLNTVSHWWDGSQLYGATKEIELKLRSGVDGKMKIKDDHSLLYNNDDYHDDIPQVGFVDNWWLGLGILYKLFLLEHNAICDRLKSAHPDLTDEELFGRARLVVSALLAKIHTVEWTPGLLATPALDMAMNGNWNGLIKEKRTLPRLLFSVYFKLAPLFSSKTKDYADEVYRGILSTEPDHHTAPYSMTEEFAAMYRLHPLIPDEFKLYSASNNELLTESNLFDLSGGRTREVLENLSLSDLTYSFGIAHPGALRLHNYPRFLQNLRRDNGDRFDLGTIDVLRDRERGIPRYNAFREAIGLPKFESFESLSDNEEWVRELREVYNDDLESVDLMVGMFAEPLIEGFSISETAFRVFVLMASRRLKSDRFFTSDYRAEIYTQEGLDWIEENTMGSVIKRHLPELSEVVNPDNAFAPWKKSVPNNE